MAKPRRTSSGKWELALRHRMLPKGRKYFTFPDEASAVEFARKWKALTAAGLPPPSVLLEPPKAAETLMSVLRAWMATGRQSTTDDALCALLMSEVGQVPIAVVTYSWAERWVEELKLDKNLAPSTNPDVPVKILDYVQMHGGMHVTEPLPTFAKGSTEMRIKTATIDTAPSDFGAFRTDCPQPVKMAFDDSLVYPGKPGDAHGHVFFGNDGSDAFSTAESIRTTGGGGCHGGIANRTTYWLPMLIDTLDNTPVVPDGSLFYYKNGSFSTAKGYGWAGTDGVWHEVIVTDPVTNRPTRKWPGFTDLPVGLAMIAGSPARTTPRANSDIFDFRWTCIGPPGQGTLTQASEFPTSCPVGGYVIQEVFFPQCWDGKNIDSPDHKSHMSFTINVKNEGDSRGWSHQECPSTHPVIIPSISFNVHYNVTDAARQKRLRLVSDTYTGPAGYSSHGDWRNGWDAAVSSAWTENCIRQMRDCHADLLGDGRTLY